MDSFTNKEVGVGKQEWILTTIIITAILGMMWVCLAG